MSMAEKIRQKLEQNPNTSVAALVKKLGVSPHHVYQVRHDMKKKQLAKVAATEDRLARAAATRSENTKSLSQHILDILEISPDGLTDHQLFEAVQKAGYITRSTAFMTVLRSKLYAMVEIGTILKNGTSYTHPAPKQIQAEEIKPEQQEQPINNNNHIDMGVFVEVAQLCKKFGGVSKIQPYLDMIKAVE